MAPTHLTPEQRASIASAYRFLASRVIWAGGPPFDPRPDLIRKARELERVEAVHVHDGGSA